MRQNTIKQILLAKVYSGLILHSREEHNFRDVRCDICVQLLNV